MWKTAAWNGRVVETIVPDLYEMSVGLDRRSERERRAEGGASRCDFVDGKVRWRRREGFPQVRRVGWVQVRACNVVGEMRGIVGLPME